MVPPVAACLCAGSVPGVSTAPTGRPDSRAPGLPEAFVIVDENDVLRDEGEPYARKLTEVGVRNERHPLDGILHDFMS